MFEVHINKRKGNKAKVQKAQAVVDAIEREVRHERKYLTRMTKMILSDELRMYVQRQKAAVLVAFANYAACSKVSYEKQAPLWEQFGQSINTEFGDVVTKCMEEYEKMKLEEEDSDIPEIDSSSSDEEKPVKVVKLDKKDKKDKKEETYSSESESVPEVSSSDSDDLDNVSDSSEDL